jgi:hypothetical protein
MEFGFCPEVVLELIFLNDGLVYRTVAHAKLADKMIVNCRNQAPRSKSNSPNPSVR